jgi:uncharacterized membrane protein
MTAPRKAPLTLSDERMDAIIGMLLRTGVLLASAVVLVGGVLYLLHNGGVRPSYRIFKGEPAQLRQLPLLLHQAASADPAALIQLGLLLLVATPVARVLFAAVAFALQRDRLYTLVSAVILGVLVTSFFLLH